MDQPNQLQPSLMSFPSLSCSQPISPSLTTWILPMSWSTTITSKWWFLIDTTPSLKSLPYSTPSPILHSPYLSRIRIMDVSRSCIHKHHPFHQCHGYSRDSRFGRAYDHSIRFILSIIFRCMRYNSAVIFYFDVVDGIQRETAERVRIIPPNPGQSSRIPRGFLPPI